MNDIDGRKLVGALVAGLKILRHLARAPVPVAVSPLARELKLNPSTCFNLLKTLVHERLVDFDIASKTYTIGLGVMELVRGALEHSDYVRLVRAHLEQIAARHAVTAQLWQRSGDDRVVLVDRVDNDSAIHVHMNVGQRLPIYIAALGRCIAAHEGLSQPALRREFEKLRWGNAPSFQTYCKEIERARARGYALDEGTYVRGVTTASAAVIDENGRAVMAISAVGFSAQFKAGDLRALGEDLRDRARQVSRTLAGGRMQAA